MKGSPYASWEEKCICTPNLIIFRPARAVDAGYDPDEAGLCPALRAVLRWPAASVIV